MKLTLESVRPLLAPIGLFVGLLLLGLFAGRFILGRMGNLRESLRTINAQEQTLIQKEQVLQSVDSVAAAFSEASIVALPSSNPALSTLSQIRFKASSFSLLLGEVEVGSEIEDKNGLSRVEVGFDVQGPFSSVTALLASLSKVAPIGRIESANITQSAGAARAVVTYSSFWSSLPQRLPALTDSLGALTPAESQVIDRLTALERPTFTQINPTNPQTPGNPFSF